MPLVVQHIAPRGLTIRVRGLESAVRALAPFDRRPIAGVAMQEAADWLQMNLQEYPPPPHPPYKLRFYSEKQRRFVMWALRTGVIVVPYRRTRRLAEGWKVDVHWRFGRDEITARVYNAVPYVIWVMGDRMQAYMHRGYWPTVSEVYRREEAEIDRIIRETVNRYLR